MATDILATYTGTGKNSRVLYVVVTDEVYNSNKRPIPENLSGKIIKYRKLSNLKDTEAHHFRLSRDLNEQRKRNRNAQK